MAFLEVMLYAFGLSTQFLTGRTEGLDFKDILNKCIELSGSKESELFYQQLLSPLFYALNKK